MARKYSAPSNMFLERSAREHTVDGKIEWEKVLKEVGEESKTEPTLGALKIRYRRLLAQNGIKPRSRAGDKTLKRVVKWMENLVASNNHMRARLDSKQEKPRNSGRMELLKKKNKELREKIRNIKKELKSHGPILKWYIDAQKGFKIAKEKKALITE